MEALCGARFSTPFSSANEVLFPRVVLIFDLFKDYCSKLTIYSQNGKIYVIKKFLNINIILNLHLKMMQKLNI